MLSFMLTVCVTNIECLNNKSSTLQMQYNLDVVLCQLFMIASDCQQLKQLPMISKCVCITSIIY